jgi:hypothetical protein
MITIHLSTEDLTKVRLAPSPLWETVTSFGVLLHHEHDPVHAAWAARARRVLPGTDLSALVAAMCVAGRCPDFLTPPPDASVATFGEELERLRATPAEVVHEEVEVFVRQEKQQFGSLAPEKVRLLEIYLSDPEGSLERLVGELRRYHDLALAPYWPRIQEHLEGDTIRRGQALALGGVEALLSGLHPKASYGRGRPGAGQGLRGDYRARRTRDNPCALRLRLAPCRGTCPTRLPAYPRVRSPRGGEPVELLIPCAQWGSDRGRPGSKKGVHPQGPSARAGHHDRARPPTSPEPRYNLGPPLAAQGRTAGRAASQRQKSLLSAERCR